MYCLFFATKKRKGIHVVYKSIILLNLIVFLVCIPSSSQLELTYIRIIFPTSNLVCLIFKAEYETK